MFQLIEVRLSDGLEKIGSRAFSQCTNLKRVNDIPSTVQEMGDDAFAGCTTLFDNSFQKLLRFVSLNPVEGLGQPCDHRRKRQKLC